MRDIHAHSPDFAFLVEAHICLTLDKERVFEKTIRKPIRSLYHTRKTLWCVKNIIRVLLRKTYYKKNIKLD